MHSTLLLSLLSCSSGVLTVPDVPLELEVIRPESGQFTGTDTVRVVGVVAPAAAVVTVENRRVNVGTDGTFDVSVPIDGGYRNVDVRAFYREDLIRERIPVFSGVDPTSTFPGGIGLRLTPRLLEGIADQIAMGLDDAGLGAALLDGLEPIETDGFSLTPVSLTNRPVEVSLVPTANGLDLTIRVRDLTLTADGVVGTGDSTFAAPTSGGWGEILLTAQLGIFTDSEGMLRLSGGEASLAFDNAFLQLGPFEGDALLFIVEGLGDLTAGIGDFLLDAVLGGLDEIELGGPFETEIDFGGSPATVSLDALGSDSEGIFVDLGLGLNGAASGGAGAYRPTLAEGGPGADLIISLHEGLFASLLESDLLDLLNQDLELNGVLGVGAGLVFRGLPGGDTAPEADGWCIGVQPGEAKTARMTDDPERLARILLPDLRLDIGVSHDGITCDPWLDASLAVVATVGIDGLTLGIDLDAPDGAVFFYAAEGEYPEAEIVDGLGGLLGLITTFTGGALEFDLGDILGGEMGGTEPRVTGVTAIRGMDGQPVPGLYALALDVL